MCDPGRARLDALVRVLLDQDEAEPREQLVAQHVRHAALAVEERDAQPRAEPRLELREREARDREEPLVGGVAGELDVARARAVAAAAAHEVVCGREDAVEDVEAAVVGGAVAQQRRHHRRVGLERDDKTRVVRRSREATRRRAEARAELGHDVARLDQRVHHHPLVTLDAACRGAGEVPRAWTARPAAPRCQLVLEAWWQRRRCRRHTRCVPRTRRRGGAVHARAVDELLPLVGHGEIRPIVGVDLTPR